MAARSKFYSGSKWAALLVGVLAVAASWCAAAQSVTTKSGKVSGRTVDGVTAFLGIPYAAAPIGVRRFTPPAPAPHWAGSKDVTTFGASCPQPSTNAMRNGFGPFTPEYLVSGETSEDCLFLNIWTPTTKAAANRPVMMWIHGGGFTAGSGAVAIYGGQLFAKEGIVVVTVNYRLGPLGFLAVPALGLRSGNYGLMDMIAALHWIKDNIASFGGDPSRVTIAGQSAGSSAVHALVASPAAKGLFSRAIAESGSGLTPPAQSRESAEKAGAVFLKSKNVTTLAQLRSLPASEFVEVIGEPKPGAPPPQPPIHLSPVFDEEIVSTDPLMGSDVPHLTGLNADESSAANFHYGEATPEEVQISAEKIYGTDAPQLLALYPAPDSVAAGLVSKQIKQDFGAMSTWLWAVDRAKTAKSPVYMYLFRHVEPGPSAVRYGAFHTSEVPYVFGTLDKGDRQFADIDRSVSRTMRRYWINFISTGNPNGANLPTWPELSAESPEIMDISESFVATPLLTPEKRTFFTTEVARGVRSSLL